jgi:photosystem II stability/assembly factor-like uncharacterized protein
MRLQLLDGPSDATQYYQSLDGAWTRVSAASVIAGEVPGERAMHHQDWTCESIGVLPGGTVTSVAISPSFDRDRTCLAATMAGLYRSEDGGVTWRRDGGGIHSLSLAAVAVSPEFADDGLVLVAGLGTGLFRVVGGKWTPSDFGNRAVRIVGLVISPAFARDGICFAATMDDGVFRSGDRGARWKPCNFGLLDLDVIALTISPDFAQDGTLVAATATGLFRSPNGGLAWREMVLPVADTPVLCAAFSPDFGVDGRLYAGTDGAGLFCSTDRGATWQLLHGPFDTGCINGVALSPAFASDRTLLLAVDTGLYVSHDGGESWVAHAAVSGAQCLAVAPTFPSGGPVLAGLSRDGISRSMGNLANWEPASEGLSGRMLTGMALSLDYAADRRLVTFGTGEGVLSSDDGGQTWVQADDALPSLDVSSVVFAGVETGEHRLFAALPQGIWTCTWGTFAWKQVAEVNARALVVLPAHEQEPSTLVAATDDGRLWASDEGTATWHSIDIPWERQQLLALEVAPDTWRASRLLVVLRDPQTETVGAWEGAIGSGWTRVAQFESGQSPVSFAVASNDAGNAAWYVASANQILGPFADGAGQPTTSQLAANQPPGAERPMILDLAVLRGPRAGLLAATTQGVYFRPTDEQGWQLLDNGAPEGPVFAVVPSPDGQVLALEVGGALWSLNRTAGIP